MTRISRIEQRTDLLISTLRGYVEAMGGKLHLIAEFPDRPTIELSGLAAMEKEKPSRVGLGGKRKSREG